MSTDTCLGLAFRPTDANVLLLDELGGSVQCILRDLLDGAWAGVVGTVRLQEIVVSVKTRAPVVLSSLILFDTYHRHGHIFWLLKIKAENDKLLQVVTEFNINCS